MKIGIDIDGVLIDFERNLRTYADIFDYIELNKSGVVNPNEQNVQKRYDWNEKEAKSFVNKYFLRLTDEASFLPGVNDVIKMLQDDGHELIVISARGGLVEKMKDFAENKLNKAGFKFNKYYWKQDDKLEVAKKENIDVMIDDSYKVCKKLSENKIKVLYLRDKNMPKLEENEYIKDVSNWGEIYREISQMRKNGL